jgi:hypothetical protein
MVAAMLSPDYQCYQSRNATIRRKARAVFAAARADAPALLS